MPGQGGCRGRTPAVLGLLTLAVVAIGCGGPGLDAGTRDGEKVLYAPTASIRSLDPARVGDVTSVQAVAMVYETLYEYHYLKRPYTVRPLLAAAMPEVSEDGRVVTIPIRRGVYYQDDPCFTATGGKGREVVAEDFIHAIRRVADARIQSPGFWAFRGRIVGLDAWREQSQSEAGPDYDAPIEGLAAPDPHTLVITLTEPYPQLLHILALHYAVAIPREATEAYGDALGQHPVGTGPFILHDWIRNYRIEFVRNPTWARTGRIETYPAEGEPGDAEAGLLAAAGQPIPFLDRVVQFQVGDASTAWLMFMRGQFATSDIGRDRFDLVVGPDRALNPELAVRGIELRQAPTLTMSYLGFNMTDPVVGPNRPLRQALAHAFDGEIWVRFHNGRLLIPNGPIPEGVAGHASGPPPYPYDLDRARDLLEEAGFPGGIDPATGRRLELTLEIGGEESAEIRQTVDLLASFWAPLGVVLRPSYNARPAFWEKMARGQFQIVRLSWVADYPDAQNFLQLFYGPNATAGPNRARFTDPEYDALYEEMRGLADGPARDALIRRMVSIVNRESPWIYAGQPVSYVLSYPWLLHHKPHAFPYGMRKVLDVAPVREF